MPKRKSMKIFSAFALLGVFIASPVFAGSESFYAGLKLAQASSGFKGLGFADSNSVELGVVGFSGGYQFTRDFSMEAEYSGLGNTTSVTSGEVSINAVGTLRKINERYSFYGKLGLANTFLTTSPIDAGVKHTAASYGLGIQYIVSKRGDIRIGWDRYSVGVLGQISSVNTYTFVGIFRP